MIFKDKRRYYLPGIDNINQLVETPESSRRTDSRRFLINTAISSIAAVAAIVAAVVTILMYLQY